MAVEAVAVTGRWWRHIPAGGDPLWRPETPADGRWQRGSAVEGYYLADEPATGWAEWYRFLAELAIPPDRGLPRDLWAFDVRIQVANLSTADRLDELGLGLPRPTRLDWTLFQHVGEQLHARGWGGLLAPSAARPDHRVLCVFRTRDELPGVVPTPPPERFDAAPAPPRGMTT